MVAVTVHSAPDAVGLLSGQGVTILTADKVVVNADVPEIPSGSTRNGHDGHAGPLCHPAADAAGPGTTQPPREPPRQAPTRLADAGATGRIPLGTGRHLTPGRVTCIFTTQNRLLCIRWPCRPRHSCRANIRRSARPAVRDIPARSLAVSMAEQSQSDGNGSRQVTRSRSWPRPESSLPGRCPDSATNLIASKSPCTHSTRTNGPKASLLSNEAGRSPCHTRQAPAVSHSHTFHCRWPGPAFPLMKAGPRYRSSKLGPGARAYCAGLRRRCTAPECSNECASRRIMGYLCGRLSAC